MTNEKIKELLNRDNSTPQAPLNELNNIHRRINEKPASLIERLGIKQVALVLSLLIVITLSKTGLDSISTPKLTEQEQADLIEYMLEDAYLSNGESSYAWVEINN
ncbi:hypothetical protein BIY24_00205 [Halobacteriovorax marinus]|uniref:hypothetical protein n=1 Tax=Halobacteriovorax marinus TaxID=97084 RepID=UPI000BC314EE|nr:hypothetical protein [Halobacteriovorax marinus]ATH06418.1 hypothetical protein BIY24_00205 [Halobacteriovorax marinus]